MQILVIPSQSCLFLCMELFERPSLFAAASSQKSQMTTELFDSPSVSLTTRGSHHDEKDSVAYQ
jgi:hypothetical protein